MKNEDNKKFSFERCKQPLVVAAIAAVLFCIDSLIAPLLISDASFMWVSFAAWALSFGRTPKDKIKMIVGTAIGFVMAAAMFWFGQAFEVNLLTISIAALIGVFVVNFIAVYLDNFKKFFFYCMNGVFMGIFLTFSGLGVGLKPNTFANAGILLGILMLYVVLGVGCAFLSVLLIKKWQKKEKPKAEVDKTEK